MQPFDVFPWNMAADSLIMATRGQNCQSYRTSVRLHPSWRSGPAANRRSRELDRRGGGARGSADRNVVGRNQGRP